MDLHTYLRNFPDAQGRFGEYGGVYLPDERFPLLKKYGSYQTVAHSAQFINELRRHPANSFRDVPPRFTTANAFPATWAPLKFT